MNFFKNVFFFLLLMGTVTSTTYANNLNSNPQSIEKQIESLLVKYADDFLIQNGQEFKMDFIINSKSELVILGTSAEELDGILKTILNYKKVIIDTLEFDKVYTIPVKLKK